MVLFQIHLVFLTSGVTVSKVRSHASPGRPRTRSVRSGSNSLKTRPRASTNCRGTVHILSNLSVKIPKWQPCFCKSTKFPIIFLFVGTYLNTCSLLYLKRGTRSGSLHCDDVSGGNHLSVKVSEVNLDITRIQAARYHASVVKAIHFVSRQDLVA